MAKEKKKIEIKGRLSLEVLTPEKVVLRDSEIDFIVVKALEPNVHPELYTLPKVQHINQFEEGEKFLESQPVMDQKEMPEIMRDDVPRVMEERPGIMRDDVPRVMEEKTGIMNDNAPRVMGSNAPPMGELPDRPKAPKMGELPDRPKAPKMGDLPDRPARPTLPVNPDLPPIPAIPEVAMPIALREIGILSDHAPMLVRLPVSPIRYRKGEELHWIVVAGGFLEVKDNKVTILSFGAEKVSEEADANLAIAAKKRVESWLLEGQVGKVGFDEKAAEADIKKSAIELYKASSSSE